MKRTLIVLFIGLAFSCNKPKTAAVQEHNEEFDLSSITETDDYFRSKKKKSGNVMSSRPTRMIELNDINGDGNKDTAYIEYNENNSRYKISFTCYKDVITFDNLAELQLKDMNDLNGDGHHEILIFLQSEESCWDELRLYSWNNDVWVEKYSGLTYQCTEHNNNNYQFRKIDEHTVLLTTYGINKDSFDAELGDTLENIIPNAENKSLIVW